MAISKFYEYVIEVSALLCIFQGNANSSKLVQLNGCICPGYEVTYQCTVCGEGATVWTGSLFDCAGDEITLRHGAFESGSRGECNNGVVVASSIGVMDTNGSRCYVSQLSFIANSDHNNKTVTCLHVSSTNVTDVGSLSVFIVTESLPPPTSIHLGVVGPTYLTFYWNHDNAMNIQTDSCSNVVYNIFALNCGICPDSTSSLSITCTNITADGSNCSFAVETIVCDHLISRKSEPVIVFLKVPDAPKIEVEQFFLSSFSSSSLVHTALSEVNSINISDGVDGSVTSYRVTYYNSISQSILCGSATISVSPDFCTSLMCRHVLDVSASPCNSSTEIAIAAVATNLLGDGPESSPIYVTITTSESQFHQSNCSNVTIMRDGDFGALYITLLGTGALMVLVISSTVFITVIIILIRSRAKIERELKEIIGQSAQEMNPSSADYETIDLNQNRELHTSTIDTRDNAAYGNLSKLD